jgi:hypothetical protein
MGILTLPEIGALATDGYCIHLFGIPDIVIRVYFAKLLLKDNVQPAIGPIGEGYAVNTPMWLSRAS